MDKKKKLKARFKRYTLIATAATSLLVNNSYDNPFDLIDDNAGDNVDETDEENGKEKSQMRLKRLLGQIPLPLRTFVLMPLWFIGWILLKIILPILEKIIIPHLASITSWFVALFLVLAIIFIGATLIFPNLPIRKLFNKKTILLTVILMTILAITDKILTIVNPEYKRFKFLVKFFGSILVSIIVIGYIYFKNRKIKVSVSTDKYSFSGE